MSSSFLHLINQQRQSAKRPEWHHIKQKGNRNPFSPISHEISPHDVVVTSQVSLLDLSGFTKFLCLWKMHPSSSLYLEIKGSPKNTHISLTLPFHWTLTPPPATTHTHINAHPSLLIRLWAEWNIIYKLCFFLNTSHFIFLPWRHYNFWQLKKPCLAHNSFIRP